MNKLGLILMTGLVLAGCASEQAKDPDALPNGIMQPQVDEPRPCDRSVPHLGRVQQVRQ